MGRKFKNTLTIVLSLFLFHFSHAQFTAYRADDNVGAPECGTLQSGVEIWGGFGVTTIAQCVNTQFRITDWNLQPIAPGWFGDVQGTLYYFNGGAWDITFNTTCGGGGGCNSPPPNTWYISTIGDDATGNGSDNCPYATLSKAISAASAGDVINIAAGTYGRAAGQATGWQNLYTNKALTIIGAGNAEAGSGGTVIDNDDRANERLIYFNSTTTGEIIIKDLIIRDFFEDRTIIIMNAENDVKLINITVHSCITEATNGNVYIDADNSNKFTNSDSIIIKNCTFTTNTTDGLNAGDYPGVKLNGGNWGYGNVLIESTKFIRNSNAYGTTSSGRLLYVYKFERLTVKKCYFTDNDNSGYVMYVNGTGAYDSYSQGDANGVTIENCVFDNNDIRYNSIYLRQCKGTISNSTFAYNTSNSGTSIATNVDGYTSSTYYERVPDFKFYNCIFHTTDNGNYNIDEPNTGYEFFTLYNCLVEGGHNSTDYTVGANVVSGDPLFTSQLDLSLSSITSPACNVGCDPGTNSCANSFTPSSEDMNNGTGYRDIYTPYDLGAFESTFSCSAPTVDTDPSDESVCIGSTPTTLSISSTGASSYQWYVNTINSNTGGTIMSAETSSTLVFPGGVTNPGNYYYYCTVSNVCGNATSNVATLAVNANPTNTISVTETSGTANDGTICSGSSVTLDAGSATTYLWDNGLGSSQVVNPSPTSTTTYNVSITDQNGCTTMDDQVITVGATPAISGVDDITIAPGGTISFDATITDCDAGSGTFGPFDFTNTSGWSSGTGFGTSSAEACNGNLYRDNAYSSYPDVYFNNSTTFFTSSGVDINVSFDYKCYDYYTPYGPTTTTEHGGQYVEYGISSNGPWSTVYTMNDYTASASCVTKTFTFTPISGQPVFLRFHTQWTSGDWWAAYDNISVEEGGCTYAWTGPNSYTASTEDIIVTTNATSSHAGTYNLTVTNQYECSATDNAVVLVQCPITVDAGSNITVAETQAISLDATVTCTPSSGTVNNEGIGSGNYASSMTSILATPGGFWSNVSGDNAQVWGESNITGSSNTGPDEPNTGDDYIYFETSSGHAYFNGDIVYLESNTISDNGVSISFYYHMFGSNIGTLEVESYDGSTWTSRWGLSGQQHLSGAAAWTQATVDLSSYTVTKLRFKYTAAGGYRGDAGLDDINISYNVPCTYAWTGPNGYTANTEDVTVTTNALNGTHDGTYTLTVNNGNCSTASSLTVTVTSGPPTWTGGSNANWTDPANWENNVLPTSTSDVVIGSGSNVPAVTTDITINSLTIDNGGSLTIANTSGSGTNFEVSGNLEINGTLTITGDVPLEVSGTGTITFGPSSNTSAADIDVSGVYVIGSDIDLNDLAITGILQASSYNMNLSGDLNITSTFIANTSTVTFDGSSVQQVTTSGQNFNNVVINNTKNPISLNVADGLILGTNGILKLSDGVIKTVGTAPFAKVVIKNNEPNAIVGADGTPHNLTPSSYIWGNLKRHTKPSGYTGKQKYEFPIGIVPPSGGSSARYYRTRVDFTGMQGVSNITARFVVGEHPAYTSETDFANQQFEILQTDSTDAFTLARMLGEGYWRIHPNQQPTSGNYDIVLYTGVFDGQGASGKTAPVKTDTSNIAVSGWAIAGNLAADNSGNRQNSAGKIKSYGLTSFSDFGVGDGGGAALPIELLNFTAVMNDNKVTLSWTTATELNNDYFTVERTLDGIAFEEVLEMPGAGTSFTPMTYISEDASPLPGRSYYRLKQTDYDGQFEYSSMVEIENAYISDMNLYEITVANNTKVILNYHLTNHATYYLYVYDIMGKVVKEDMVYSEEGTNKYELNVKSFPSGTYFISLQTRNEIYSERFVVKR